MKQIQNSNNYNPANHKGLKTTMPGLAEPNQSMSIQEILKRYASGLPITGGKVPLYHDDEENDMPDPRHLDLAELEDLQNAYYKELRDLKDATLRSKQSAPAGPESTKESQPDLTPQYPLINRPAGEAPPEANKSKLERLLDLVDKL